MRSLVIALACVAVACTGNPTAPIRTYGWFTLTMSPNPVVSVVCVTACERHDGTQFRWMVQGTVTIKEVGGVGGNVMLIRALTNPQTVYARTDIIQRAGTNRLPARGTLVVPVTIVYGGAEDANASRSIVLTFVVDFTDDQGNQFSTGVNWTTR